MFASVARRFLGSANDRVIKSLRRTVDAINAAEPALEGLSDEALRARTAEFRERLAQGASLDDLLVEAFATVREAAKRTLGQRHFDVQLIGGMVLHRGDIAEMKTGEGKTLVATLAAYLNALPGQGVHVVTVNDYLARRDAAWMGRIYQFLGLSVGVIVPQLGRADAGATPISATSPTAPTTSSASTISGTICATRASRWSSAGTITRSSTRSTASWSTRPGPRSSSAARPRTARSSTGRSTG